MADQLSVDGAGLTAAAVGSVDIAEALATAGPVRGASTQPSHAGVAAVDAAWASVRARASGQASGHGDGLRAGSAVYTRTDDEAAREVSRSV